LFAEFDRQSAAHQSQRSAFLLWLPLLSAIQFGISSAIGFLLWLGVIVGSRLSYLFGRSVGDHLP
jgi:hypothetical protein